MITLTLIVRVFMAVYLIVFLGIAAVTAFIGIAAVTAFIAAGNQFRKGQARCCTCFRYHYGTMRENVSWALNHSCAGL